MQLAIGPVLFEWGRQPLREFYRRMAGETPADILYLGEVVCSKRNNLTLDDLTNLAEEIRAAGKEPVFSTLGLVMSQEEQTELGGIANLAKQLGVRLEVNDLAGLALGEGSPMVAGPHITTYNSETMQFLAQVGVDRVVLPVELPQSSVALMAKKKGQVALEQFAYGRLPLTFSARCYTARAFALGKSNCQYKCGEFPDGMPIKTQEDESFLTLNGLETMSYRIFNLIPQVPVLREMGVDILRLSPQSRGMVEIVNIWRERLDDRIDATEALARLTRINQGEPFCNGYFLGLPGLNWEK